MPKPIVLGNGTMLVNMDTKGLIHDFYFPHVGMEDHTTFGHYHRIGIFEEGTKNFTWLTDDHWQSHNEYLPETLVSKTILKSDEWGIEITFLDGIHPIENIFSRNIQVKNWQDNDRHFRFFFNFDFHLYGVKGNDTVYYYPKDNYLTFFKFNRYFLVNGKSREGGIQQYATGKSEYRGLLGTWKDAEDGELSGHPIEQGSVDATFALHTHVPAKNETTLEVWICAGEDEETVEKLNKKVEQISTSELLDYTANYWKSWVNKQNFNFNGVPENVQKLFKQSLLIIRTQIDKNGAIIAANDTDIVKFNKDTYSYMWPRDGALIAKALDNTGYMEITKRFFHFCQRVQTSEGYLRQKYNPDGSVGSTWHPWRAENYKEIPFQLDETALPVIALWNHYQRIHDIEFIQTLTETFVMKAANFIMRYRNKKTNLPLTSYDLWEEKRGIFTWTCATAYQALVSAAELFNVVGHDRHSKKYAKQAEKLKKAIIDHLYCPQEKTFVKKVTFNNGVYEKDYTPDASISAIWMFGVLPPDDPRVVNTMKRIKEKLTVKTDIGGLARYTGDTYQAVGHYPNEIPGNPWIITTLWYANWLLSISKDHKDPHLQEAEEIIQWATKQATSTGTLPEQINPYTGEHLSVSPLTWSHSTYVNTIMLYRQKLTEFGICEECFVPDAYSSIQ